MSLFNINKVICLNLKAMEQRQLFIASTALSIDFEVLLKYKNQRCLKLWICQETSMTIAFEQQDVNKFTGELLDKEFYFFPEVCPVTKKEHDRVTKMKPIVIPKVSKNDDTLNSYLFYLEKGYDIKMPSLDRKIEHIRNNQEKNTEIEQTKVVTEVISKTKKQVSLEIDTILDKINESGIESLTKEEKEFLDNL
jgi:hypothetical protein